MEYPATTGNSITSHSQARLGFSSRQNSISVSTPAVSKNSPDMGKWPPSWRTMPALNGDQK